MTSGESTYAKANGIFFAVGKQGGGGPVYIQRLDQPGRFKANAPLLSVQKGKIIDLDFHPFIDNMLATAGEDCKIHVTQFPMTGLTETITKPNVSIGGHSKKISLIQFNPTAKSIIASGAYDKTVKIFNIETSSMVNNFGEIQDNIYSLEWNKNGSMLAITSKQRSSDPNSKSSIVKLSLFDPRNSKETCISFEAFDGIKSSKCFWVPSFNWIGAVGFSKSARRMLKIWDPRNYEKPLYQHVVDQQSSILCPKMDYDLNVLYLAGKGDSTISYWELANDEKLVHSLSAYRDTLPQKGGAWVAKRGLDVFKCEVQRFLKLTNNSIQPISFIVPRKSGQDIFQDDIYPDCFAGKAALTSNEWINGENKDPITMSMNPDDRKEENEEKQNNEVFTAKPSYEKIENENIMLKNKVTELEQTIKELQVATYG